MKKHRFELGLTTLGLMALTSGWAEPVLYVSTQYYASPPKTIYQVTPDGSIRIFVSGLSGAPFGIAIDSVGNLYAATNYTTNSILKITPQGTVSTFASGLGNPVYLTIDSSGNLYSANHGDKTISKISPGGTVSTFAQNLGGLEGPYGMAFDSNGNLFASVLNGIMKITPDGLISTFTSDLLGDYAYGLAFDSFGNLFFSDSVHNNIDKVSPDGVVSRFVTGSFNNIPVGSLNAAYQLAFDSLGNLYAANTQGNSVSRITPDGTVSLYASGMNEAFGIAFGTASPVPEPSTYAALAGLCVLGFAAYRRRRSRSCSFLLGHGTS